MINKYTYPFFKHSGGPRNSSFSGGLDVGGSVVEAGAVEAGAVEAGVSSEEGTGAVRFGLTGICGICLICSVSFCNGPGCSVSGGLLWRSQ